MNISVKNMNIREIPRLSEIVGLI